MTKRLLVSAPACKVLGICCYHPYMKKNMDKLKINDLF